MDETTPTQYDSSREFGRMDLSKNVKRNEIDNPHTGRRPLADAMDQLDNAGRNNAREAMRQKISTAVATVAGALEGFASTMKDTKLADSAKEALEQVGKTTRQVAQTAKHEALRVRDAVVRATSSPNSEAFGDKSQSDADPFASKSEDPQSQAI